MRIALLLLILSIPPTIELAVRKHRSEAAGSPAILAIAPQARIPAAWMVPLVEAILIAGYALSRRERRLLDAWPSPMPATRGPRPRPAAPHLIFLKLSPATTTD